MNKQEFLDRLRAALTGLPQNDIEERLAFYREMIDDRMEDGLPEDAAVAEMGSVEQIVSQTIADIPLPRLVKERIKPGRRLRGWEIGLLILGAPVWVPLLIAAGAVLLAVYAAIGAVLIALWAAEIALIAGAVGGAAGCVWYVSRGFVPQGVLLIGAGLVLAGLSIFLFFGCKAAARGIIGLTKKIAVGVKSLFVRKEGAR